MTGAILFPAIVLLKGRSFETAPIPGSLIVCRCGHGAVVVIVFRPSRV